jgi:hypothetical protein
MLLDRIGAGEDAGSAPPFQLPTARERAYQPVIGLPDEPTRRSMIETARSRFPTIS